MPALLPDHHKPQQRSDHLVVGLVAAPHEVSRIRENGDHRHGGGIAFAAAAYARAVRHSNADVLSTRLRA